VPPNPAGVTPGREVAVRGRQRALTAGGLVNTKLEGMSVIRVGRKAVLPAVNDNDFDLAHQSHPADNPTSNPTTIAFVRLPAGCA
jgi:hypothetical protein